MKSILLFILMLVFMPFIYAQDSEFVLKLEQEYDLKFRCLDEINNYCTDLTNCTIAITKPDYTNLIYNKTMTYNLGYYNYTISQYILNQEGKYDTAIQCTNGTSHGFSNFYFEVNKNVIETSVYGDTEIGIIIAIGIFLVALIGLFSYLGYIFYKAQDMSFFLCFLFWYIAMLIPLFIIRMISSLTLINTNLKELLSTMYTVYLIFYGFMILFLIIYLMALVMGYLDWQKKPGWMKRQQV
jgi:hypothetical protein